MTPRSTKAIDHQEYIIADLQAKITDIKNEMANTKGEFAALKAEIVTMKNDYSKILDLLTKIHDNMDKLHTSMTKIASEHVLNDAKITLLEKAVDELKKKQEYQSKWVWMVSGGGVVIGFLISTAIKYGGAFIPHQ
jgi:chromosome segregation ATPase